MPGVMNNLDDDTFATDCKMPVTNGESADIAMSSHDVDAPKVNGIHLPPNGQLVNGVTPTSPATDPETTNALQNLVGQLPPEIEHMTLGYVSMSALIRRLVQETFNGLGDVIDEMADISVPQPQMNGVTNHFNNRNGVGAINDASQPNVRKKTRMFDFANSRRAQFIKMLVLSKWARQAEAISKVIDLRIWLVQKQEDFASAVHWMGVLKRSLAPLKESTPDIKTALEVLSLGKASWIPDLRYLPPEEQTPKQMLHGLQRTNALLSIRLNLHEAIPPVLKDFSIASGRVTFRVPDEFEIDLSIADEDHTRQLYFIDLRLVFSPAPAGLPVGRLRDEFEARANDLLSREGLKGLYDHAHNLILTQKLLALRNQAYDMARNYWSEHLKVEPVRRAVVVQYWCDRPGAKSWIEIGIKRGQRKLMAHTHEEQNISGIMLRWFREAKQVKDFEIDLRLGRISMTYILEQIIAQHTSFSLCEISARLRRSSIYSSGRLRLRDSKSSTTPSEVSLLIQLTAWKAVKMLREPVSGRLCLLPSSDLCSRAEHELNRFATLRNDGAHQILVLRSLAAHGIVEGFARRIGWELVRSFRPSQETFQQLFPKGTQRARYYQRASWHPRWVLAFTTSPDGDTWWAVETVRAEPLSMADTSLAADGHSKAFKIPLYDAESLSFEPSLSLLTQIERTATGIISQHSDASHLASSRIPHRMQAVSSLGTVQRLPSIYLRLPANQAPALFRSADTLQLPWAHEVVKLDYQGMNSSHSSAIQTATARVSQPFSNMKDLAANMAGAAFHSNSGAFTLQLRTRVGETSVPQLLHRVAGIGRLHELIATVKAQKLIIRKFSMGYLEFTYKQAPETLRASIRFPDDGSIRLSLNFPNPHLRILDHLNSKLRHKGLANVLSAMLITLPLLSGLAKIESSHSSPNMSILSRSEQWYQVRYSGPAPKGGFDIQLKQRRDEPQWLISDQSIMKPVSITQEDQWQQSLRDVTRGKGQGWRGVNGGIIATLNGIQEVVEKLDGVFTQANRHIPEASRAGKRKAEGEAVVID